MSTAAPVKPNQSSYTIGRPHGKCAVSGTTIEPGTKFMAALRETPLGFERVDVLVDHWDNFDRQDVLGFWQTTMPAAEMKKKIFVDDIVLSEIFERLCSATEAAKLNFRFVLGLILMRKRIIIYENTRYEGESEIWSVRFKGRDDRLELINPKLDEAQVLEVSGQLSEVLNEEL